MSSKNQATTVPGFKKQNYKINGMEFELTSPTPRQKMAVVELMEERGMPYSEFIEAAVAAETAANGEVVTAKTQASIVKLNTLSTTTDIDAQIFAIWAKRVGKTASETYAEYKDILIDWFMENGTGARIADFFGAAR